MTTLLETGSCYAATVHLGPIDRFADNPEVKEKFESVGFIEVVVYGDGRHRTVKGKWAGRSEEHEVPNQITNIEKL